MKNYDFLIIGGGIFGITAAIELRKRKYEVGLINPNTIPHHLAASTDVTKAVRMDYGSDLEYFRMVEQCLPIWREWNERFGEKLFHEMGFLLLCQDSLESPKHKFEYHCRANLLEAGYVAETLDAKELAKRYPMVNTEKYPFALYNPVGGYAESGRVVEVLAEYARELGVAIHENQTASKIETKNGRIEGVSTAEGQYFSCGNAIVAAGVHTPNLLPELQPYMKSTGHPVFWLKPHDPRPFSFPNLPVFSADTSNTGWYGFPFLPKYGIVKVARHTNGILVDPDQDDRQIQDSEVGDMREFLQSTFPALADAPLVFTRRCLYTDTLDGHFWIDQHPEIKGLSVSTGGSGHGFKMAPLLGAMTADIAEGKEHEFSKRYRWRHLSADTVQVEEARYILDRKI